MKKTKEQLEVELTKQEILTKEAERSLYTLRQELSELLSGSINYRSGLGSYSDTLTWNQIKARIAQFKGQALGEGKILPMVEWHIKEENAKLWYMIRVAMGDEKRTEPRNLEMMEKVFKNPEWDK